MVLLVFVGSLAVASVQRSFTSQRAFRAADLVRAELNRARIAAVRTGKIHGFFYFPQSANFKIAPFDDETVRVLQQNAGRNSRVAPSNFDFGDQLLPRGVVFVEGEVVQDARSEFAFEENGQASSGVRPILFYPDGTSQTAQLFLRSEESDYVTVKLRGMTGTSTAAPLLEGSSRTR
jgi:Tfp pilus assembly protein FimT